jgi:hypothetical protein
MLGVAGQNTAEAAPYAPKKLGADKETAGKVGEEVKVQLPPMRFMWLGRPMDRPLKDVFAHGFFMNLPVGGVMALPPLDFPSAALGGPPMALHAYLVLELLLLCWPDPQVPYVEGGGEAPEMGVVVWQRWEWLLLMVALLQQTSTEQKQQFLRERGPLLMQLLYKVLLEDNGMGAPNSNGLVIGSDEMAWNPRSLMVTNDVEKELGLHAGSTQWTACVTLAVTMVLQNLLFESLPESWVNPGPARIGIVLTDPSGK